jgi:hypothetical protein
MKEMRACSIGPLEHVVSAAGRSGAFRHRERRGGAGDRILQPRDPVPDTSGSDPLAVTRYVADLSPVDSLRPPPTGGILWAFPAESDGAAGSGPPNAVYSAPYPIG